MPINDQKGKCKNEKSPPEKVWWPPVLLIFLMII